MFAAHLLWKLDVKERLWVARVPVWPRNQIGIVALEPSQTRKVASQQCLLVSSRPFAPGLTAMPMMILLDLTHARPLGMLSPSALPNDQDITR